MAFWNRNRKKPRTVEVKTLGYAGDALRNFLLYGATGATTPASAISLYEESSAVSIPINRIAKLFSTLDPVLEVDGKKLTDHPLLDLLRHPCKEFSKELLFQSLATYYLVTGETFALALGIAGKPALELWPISPAEVNHQVAGGLISKFQVTNDAYSGVFSNREGAFIDEMELRQLIQIRDFNPSNSSMLRGRSRLIAASNAARQQVLGVRHNLSILEKGGRLSLIFHFENDLDEDEYVAIEERVRSKFGGADNAGQVLVTAGGKLTTESPGMTNMDMDWANSMRISQDTLLLTYDLPLSLFSLEASTMDNYRTGLEAIYDDAVIPLSKVIFGKLKSDLFERFGLDKKVNLTFDKDNVSALVMRRNAEVKLRKDIDVETDNELRGMLGREPYAGGDVKYKSSTEIPIGTDIMIDDDDVEDDDELEDDDE